MIKKIKINRMVTMISKTIITCILSFSLNGFSMFAYDDLTTVQSTSVVETVWGTAPVSFDTTTGILTVGSGTLESYATSQFVDANNLILKSEVKSVILLDNVVAPVNSAYLFSDNTGNENDENSYFWTNLTYITGELDVSNVTDMTSMFLFAQKLENIDVSNWDVSNVENMNSLFRNCLSIENIDVSNWNISNVNSLNTTFAGMKRLTNLDVSNWNTSNITDLGGTFASVSSLKNLDVSNWDVSKVTIFQQLFQYMESIETLDVSKWNTSNVTSMDWTFANMPNLIEVDVSNWDVSKVWTMMSTFEGDKALKKLDLSKWDTINNRTFDVNVTFFFKETYSLQEIKLGPASIFTMNDVFLPAIDTSTGVYTGAWEKVTISTDTEKLVYESSHNFMTEYDGMVSGTYVWQVFPKITTKDSTLYVGDNWTAKDNFVSAVATDGNDVSFASIVFSGVVDTTTPGIYKVTYKNGTAESIATITVKEDKKTIITKDSTLYVGDNWTASDNFVSATDKEGNELLFSSINVTGSVNIMTSGIYKVTYKNGTVESVATITVKDRESTTNLETRLPVTGNSNSNVLIAISLLFLSLIVFYMRKKINL